MHIDPPPHSQGSAAHAGKAGVIEVIINGETRVVSSGTTVAQLVTDLGFGDKRVAVERNREVVPRANHATTELAGGDRVEVVTFVGGGQ